MDLDHQLCYCYHIPKRKILNFVRQTRPPRASQISECFGAGSGCGWCIPFLIRIHEAVMQGESVEADDVTPEEYEAMRAEYRRCVAEGARDRNSYDAPCGPTPARKAVDAKETPGHNQAPSSPVKPHEEAFDFTRYFSRSRPDPEPENLR